MHNRSDPPHTDTKSPGRRCSRILVVDDDPGIRALCSGILADEGFEVIEATDGQEGFAWALRDPPDLVLLDVGMPVLDGFGLAVALRGDERTRDIPFVFITGEAQPELEAHAYEIGALGFFAKPFEPSVLSAFVRRVLEPFRPDVGRQALH
ncbi:MAG: response regulator [Actinobacteria bacterium]|nr:response regulator [Actinomycetota bacterium]